MTSSQSGQNLGDIAKIAETSRVEEANAYLELGWELLATHTQDEGIPGRKSERTTYCLGWRRSLGDPVHPESDHMRQIREKVSIPR